MWPEGLLQRLSLEDLVSPSSFPFWIAVVIVFLAVLRGSMERAPFGYNQSLNVESTSFATHVLQTWQKRLKRKREWRMTASGTHAFTAPFLTFYNQPWSVSNFILRSEVVLLIYTLPPLLQERCIPWWTEWFIRRPEGRRRILAKKLAVRELLSKVHDSTKKMWSKSFFPPHPSSPEVSLVQAPCSPWPPYCKNLPLASLCGALAYTRHLCAPPLASPFPT